MGWSVQASLAFLLVEHTFCGLLEKYVTNNAGADPQAQPAVNRLHCSGSISRAAAACDEQCCSTLCIGCSLNRPAPRGHKSFSEHKEWCQTISLAKVKPARHMHGFTGRQKRRHDFLCAGTARLSSPPTHSMHADIFPTGPTLLTWPNANQDCDSNTDLCSQKAKEHGEQVRTVPKAPLPRRQRRPLARDAKKISWGSTCSVMQVVSLLHLISCLNGDSHRMNKWAEGVHADAQVRQHDEPGPDKSHQHLLTADRADGSGWPAVCHADNS